MADDLVPLAAYPDPVQANEAVRRLAEAGIPAVLTDESVGGLDAYLGSGIGWTKVRVRKSDLDRAAETLGGPAEPIAEEDIPWDDPDAAAAADETERAEIEQAIAEQKTAAPPESTPAAPPDDDEQLVTTGYRLAVCGFFFLPLTFASVVFVVIAAFRVKTMSPGARRRFKLSVLINLVWLGFWVFLCGGGFKFLFS